MGFLILKMSILNTSRPGNLNYASHFHNYSGKYDYLCLLCIVERWR